MLTPSRGVGGQKMLNRGSSGPVFVGTRTLFDKERLDPGPPDIGVAREPVRRPPSVQELSNTGQERLVQPFEEIFGIWKRHFKTYFKQSTIFNIFINFFDFYKRHKKFLFIYFVCYCPRLKYFS